jgi:hypothetical protein
MAMIRKLTVRTAFVLALSAANLVLLSACGGGHHGSNCESTFYQESVSLSNGQTGSLEIDVGSNGSDVANLTVSGESPSGVDLTDNAYQVTGTLTKGTFTQMDNFSGDPTFLLSFVLPSASAPGAISIKSAGKTFNGVVTGPSQPQTVPCTDPGLGNTG